MPNTVRKLALIGILSASVAHTEMIPLRAGSLDFDNFVAGDGPLHLEGRSFAFDGYAQTARVDAVDCLWGCDTGETMSLDIVVAGNDLPGVVTYRGETFPDVGSLITEDSLLLSITGRMRVPGGTANTRTKVAPCKVSGVFFHSDPPLFEPETEELIGSALATVIFQRSDFGWLVQSLSYDIRRR
jgi:hypothetical protein